MNRWLVLITIVLSGCASTARPFYVDQAFTPSETRQIQEAAQAWETATGGAVHIDLVLGVPAIGTRASRRREIVRFTPEQAAESEFSTVRDLLPDGPAVTQPGDGYEVIAIIPALLDGWSLRTVVMHELGHTLELHHVPEPFALMSSHPDREIERFAAEGCLSQADVRELVKVDVDVTMVRTCERN